MTIERAIEILNPEHREHYDSIETVNEACRMGMEALERSRWIPVEERLPEELKPVLFAVYPKDTQLYNKYGKVVYLAWRENGEWLDWEGKRVSDVFIVTHWMPLPEPPGGGIMDGLIKFPTIYMDDETAVNIVKHSLTYLDSDELTFEAMTYAIERVAMTDLTRWDLSNADLQRALRWLFDHYDFK